MVQGICWVGFDCQLVFYWANARCLQDRYELAGLVRLDQTVWKLQNEVSVVTFIDVASCTGTCIVISIVSARTIRVCRYQDLILVAVFLDCR